MLATVAVGSIDAGLPLANHLRSAACASHHVASGKSLEGAAKLLRHEGELKVLKNTTARAFT